MDPRAEMKFAQIRKRVEEEDILTLKRFSDDQLRAELWRRFREKYPEDPTPPQIHRPGEAKPFG